MSEDLKKKKRYWLGPIEIDIKYLERVIGPEEHLEYVKEIKWWNYNIDQINGRLESGWDMPPLIAENGMGVLDYMTVIIDSVHYRN